MFGVGKKVVPVKIHGYEYPKYTANYITLDQTITDPAAMLSGDINGEVVQWIRANSHRVLVKRDFDGNTIYCRLDDTNSNYYHDGTEADLGKRGVDVMLKLPVFYWQCVEQSTNVFRIGLAYGENPGEGWHKWEGDNTLCGVYEAFHMYHDFSNHVYSMSGVESTGELSQLWWKSCVHREGFCLITWEWHCIMAMLYYCLYGHMNCQTQIGAGTSSYLKTTGQTNTLGMTDTVAGGNGDNNSINFWGIENWWGNKYEWMDNIVVNARSWVITPMDGSASRTGTSVSSNGYTSKMILGEHFDLIPTNVSGSDTISYCDYYYQPLSSSSVVLRSGNGWYTSDGIAYIDARYDSSYTHSHIGSRLAFYGNLIEENDVQTFEAIAEQT